jgi:hypothetical protein
MQTLGSLDWYIGSRGIQKSRLPLCAGLAILRVLDYSLTLSLQPGGYWDGNYHCAVEASATLRWCLQQHPLVFIAAALLIIGTFSIVILCWPRKPAETIAAIMMFAHIYAVATWTFHCICGPVLCIALLYLGWSLFKSLADRDVGCRHAFA